jgi:hypothetical protein
VHDDYLQESASRADLVVSGAAAVAGAAVAFALLQVLLVTVALGTADYSTGDPGPAGAAGFGVLTAGVGGLASGVGGYLGARVGRLRSASEQQARTTALVAVLVLVGLVLVAGLAGGARVAAAALFLVGSGVGATLGARAGARRA